MPSAWEYVTKFVTYLYQHICDGNVDDIHTMYAITFKALSDDFFYNTTWPRVEDLKKHFSDDLFWLMYQVFPSSSVEFWMPVVMLLV